MLWFNPEQDIEGTLHQMFQWTYQIAYTTNCQKFEDTRVIIRNRKSKDRQYNGQTKSTKSNTTQKEVEGWEVPAPLVTAVLNDTTTIWYGNSGGH